MGVEMGQRVETLGMYVALVTSTGYRVQGTGVQGTGYRSTGYTGGGVRLMGLGGLRGRAVGAARGRRGWAAGWC